MTMKQTREQFLLALNSNAYIGMCTSEDMKNVIAALDKQIPQEPDYEGDGYWNGELVYDTWICRNCGTKYEVDYDNYECCPKCGQRIKREV